jgi:unsaturated rhamnogalacturonyl hydrolase
VAPTPTPTSTFVPDWSVKMADSFILSNATLGRWSYENGTLLEGIEQLYAATKNEKYYNYIKTNIDRMVNSSGTISGYNMSLYRLDDITPGRVLFQLYSRTGDSRYKKAMDTLRQHLNSQPRTNSGGFWHKVGYPYQMWLDGLYMAAPFYALYGKTFNEPAALDDVTIKQIIQIETRTRDANTGLLYHGWDESKSIGWADPVTGCSPSFWGRAMGWYAMAAVDVLDYLPTTHPQRTKIIEIIQRLMTAAVRYQDPAAGVWRQVVDQGTRAGNYLEASVSCMFVYAMTKSVRLGYIDSSFLAHARTGYNGIIKQFINVSSSGTVNLTGTCSGAGLGALPSEGIPYRDGTYAYYTGISTRTNDLKGIGPFIMASIEIERTN